MRAIGERRSCASEDDTAAHPRSVIARPNITTGAFGVARAEPALAKSLAGTPRTFPQRDATHAQQTSRAIQHTTAGTDVAMYLSLT
ncbi:MAG: hypothetical protein ABI629_24415 [bacterium]